jgi:hypothetical protein
MSTSVLRAASDCILTSLQLLFSNVTINNVIYNIDSIEMHGLSSIIQKQD